MWRLIFLMVDHDHDHNQPTLMIIADTSVELANKFEYGKYRLLWSKTSSKYTYYLNINELELAIAMLIVYPTRGIYRIMIPRGVTSLLKWW